MGLSRPPAGPREAFSKLPRAAVLGLLAATCVVIACTTVCVITVGLGVAGTSPGLALICIRGLKAGMRGGGDVLGPASSSGHSCNR